jgi:predicted nucleotidyltransferase
MRVIRRFAREVAERFRPEKIILFGSYAYGEPHADSDVDILVIMPARNQHAQSVKIRLAIPAPFPMDLLVRTPKKWQDSLDDGASFPTEVASKGKILYEKRDDEASGHLGLTLGRPGAHGGANAAWNLRPTGVG